MLSKKTAAVSSGVEHDEATRVSLAGLVSLRGTVRSVKRPVGGRVLAPSSGGNESRALGRGLDFAEVREYNPGDDVRMIDWKVTARSGKTHTKIYNEERERPFLIAIDLRQSMFFATRVAFKSVVAARLAAMVAWAAASNRDRVGGVVIGQHSLREIKPLAGSKGVTKLLNEIVTTHKEVRDKRGTLAHQMQHDSGPQLVDAFQHLQRIAHTGSSLCLLTDFSGFESGKGGALNQLLKHNHMAACQIHDPLEASLPSPARYSITDGVHRTTFDTSSGQLRQSYEQAFLQRSGETKKLFSGQGNSYWRCSVAQPLVPVAGHILRSLPGSV